jgi:hypothetical protein
MPLHPIPLRHREGKRRARRTLPGQNLGVGLNVNNKPGRPGTRRQKR